MPAPSSALIIRAALALGLVCTQTITLAAETHLLSANVTVAGRSQEDWSRAWWQWAGSFDRAESPVSDRSGERCADKQDGPVWFLAGTYGTRRTVRTCTVPRDKYLFFPLINYVVMSRADYPATCKDVRTTAAQVTENVGALVLEVDGVRYTGLERHRQATRKCFDMGTLAEPPARIFPSAANGYYIMLKPLPPGRHEINFGGALPDMLQAVTYTLIVE